MSRKYWAADGGLNAALSPVSPMRMGGGGDGRFIGLCALGVSMELRTVALQARINGL